MTLAEAAQHFAGQITSLTQRSAAAPVFALAQNYPNPCNAATLIEFSLRQTTPVRLTVFNANGQAVAQLIDRMLSPGNYQVRWQDATAASGVYHYRLQAGERSETRTLLLLR